MEQALEHPTIGVGDPRPAEPVLGRPQVLDGQQFAMKRQEPLDRPTSGG